MVRLSKADKAELVKALLQDYGSARAEVLLHVHLYKTQFRNFGIILAFAALLFPLLFGQSIPIPGTSVTIPLTAWTALLVLFTISTAEFFMMFSVLAALFALQVLAERCVRLEDEINDCLERKYFFWERFAHEVWGRDGALIIKMPDTAVMGLFYIFILFFCLFLPLIGVAQISCGEPNFWLTCVALAYVFYLFTLFTHGVFVNAYTMGDLRNDCRKMLKSAAEGNVTKSGRAGITSLLLVFLLAAIATSLTWAIASQPTTCAIVGSRLSIAVKKTQDQSPPVTLEHPSPPK